MTWLPLSRNASRSIGCLILSTCIKHPNVYVSEVKEVSGKLLISAPTMTLANTTLTLAQVKETFGQIARLLLEMDKLNLRSGKIIAESIGFESIYPLKAKLCFAVEFSYRRGDRCLGNLLRRTLREMPQDDQVKTLERWALDKDVNDLANFCADSVPIVADDVLKMISRHHAVEVGRALVERKHELAPIIVKLCVDDTLEPHFNLLEMKTLYWQLDVEARIMLSRTLLGG